MSCHSHHSRRAGKGGAASGAQAASAPSADGPVPPDLPRVASAGGQSYCVAAAPPEAILAMLRGKLPPGCRADADTAADSASDPSAAVRLLAQLESAVSAGGGPGGPLEPADAREMGLELGIDDASAFASHQRALSALAASPARRLSVSAARLREWTALAAALRAASDRVAQGRHELSDANLSHMPDYEGRISVLQASLPTDPPADPSGRASAAVSWPENGISFRFPSRIKLASSGERGIQPPGPPGAVSAGSRVP